MPAGDAGTGRKRLRLPALEGYTCRSTGKVRQRLPLFYEWLDVALFFGDESVLFVVAGDRQGGNMRKAFRQADREALITLGLYGFFFVWWTVFAFGLGSGDPEEYTYVWGLPAWFFYSCVLGYPVMTLILWGVVRRFFADIPLDAPEKEQGEENGK